MARFVPLAAVFLVGMVVGCGSSSADDGETNTSAVTAPSDAGTDAAPVDPCAPCAERYAAGAAKYEMARHQCFCADDVCREACAATECTRIKKPADATCTACIEESYSKCVRSVASACESDAECKQYVLCFEPTCAKK